MVQYMHGIPKNYKKKKKKDKNTLSLVPKNSQAAKECYSRTHECYDPFSIMNHAES